MLIKGAFASNMCCYSYKQIIRLLKFAQPGYWQSRPGHLDVTEKPRIDIRRAIAYPVSSLLLTFPSCCTTANERGNRFDMRVRQMPRGGGYNGSQGFGLARSADNKPNVDSWIRWQAPSEQMPWSAYAEARRFFGSVNSASARSQSSSAWSSCLPRRS